MSRTSRCFAALFSKFGGPDALPAVEQLLCPHPADSLFTSIERPLPARIVVPKKTQIPPHALLATSGHSSRLSLISNLVDVHDLRGDWRECAPR